MALTGLTPVKSTGRAGGKTMRILTSSQHYRFHRCTALKRGQPAARAAVPNLCQCFCFSSPQRIGWRLLWCMTLDGRINSKP